MRVVGADEIDAALDFPALIDALDDAFRAGGEAPERHHHVVPNDGTHLLMPAWGDGLLGVKIVNVFPGNGALGKAAVQGVYVLQDGRTGETLGVLDGTRLTVWRREPRAVSCARSRQRAGA
jgi:ornithine cyclodeaminase/alanine dehydrogenase-like protein (mu-crystallin family)